MDSEIHVPDCSDRHCFSQMLSLLEPGWYEDSGYPMKTTRYYVTVDEEHLSLTIRGFFVQTEEYFDVPRNVAFRRTEAEGDFIDLRDFLNNFKKYRTLMHGNEIDVYYVNKKGHVSVNSALQIVQWYNGIYYVLQNNQCCLVEYNACEKCFHKLKFTLIDEHEAVVECLDFDLHKCDCEKARTELSPLSFSLAEVKNHSKSITRGNQISFRMGEDDLIYVKFEMFASVYGILYYCLFDDEDLFPWCFEITYDWTEG